MSSVPTNMAKKKSRDVTCKPAIIDDLPQGKLKQCFCEILEGGQQRVLLLQKACFLLFFLF